MHVGKSEKLKVVILTRADHSSPRVLAESLQHQLREAGVECETIFGLDMLNRLVSLKESKFRLHYWLKRKAANWFKDQKIFRALKKADAVVISECIPNAFWKRLYNIEKLKNILLSPVYVYEVYALANAPTQVSTLTKNNDPLHERYDGHLFISPVTEIRDPHLSNGFCIGIQAKIWNLRPLPKKELIALVDFVQPGFEAYRQMQMDALHKAGIPFISLERRYTLDEIREVYRQVSIYFMQSYEAFGIPLLECLCTGAQVFTPDSGWPMSWRLDEVPQVHGKGELPGCFTVYDGEEDLLQKLELFKKNFDLVETPLRVFDECKKNYPAFYEGDRGELDKWLGAVKKKAV